MISRFVGVAPAPANGAVIISKMTANRGMILPLFADVAAKAVSGRRLHDGLADGLRTAAPATKKAPDETPGA